MQHKSIDGIHLKQAGTVLVVKREKKSLFSSRKKYMQTAPFVFSRTTTSWNGRVKQHIRFHTAAYGKYILPIALSVILVAFIAGMGVALHTTKSNAENSVPAVEVSGQIAGEENPAPSTAHATIQDNGIFTTPIELLHNYFESSQNEKILGERKIKLKQFLEDKNSPLADESDTIAEQPHWQLILAISFAESTLGKKCYMFNCSGIGGTNIREYKSFTNWILDFNRLLDKRYGNWTLDDMCGVYVKPCTNNWLNATKQILEELQENNIN